MIQVSRKVVDLDQDQDQRIESIKVGNPDQDQGLIVESTTKNKIDAVTEKTADLSTTVKGADQETRKKLLIDLKVEKDLRDRLLKREEQ